MDVQTKLAGRAGPSKVLNVGGVETRNWRGLSKYGVTSSSIKHSSNADAAERCHILIRFFARAVSTLHLHMHMHTYADRQVVGNITKSLIGMFSSSGPARTVDYDMLRAELWLIDRYGKARAGYKKMKRGQMAPMGVLIAFAKKYPSVIECAKQRNRYTDLITEIEVAAAKKAIDNFLAASRD